MNADAGWLRKPEEAAEELHDGGKAGTEGKPGSLFLKMLKRGVCSASIETSSPTQAWRGERGEERGKCLWLGLLFFHGSLINI